MDTDIERRSLLETNGESSEEESDLNNERNTAINVKSTAGDSVNDDELKEVKVLSGDTLATGEEQPNKSQLQSGSLPAVRYENMIQFDSEVVVKPSEELNERSRKDFLTIDLGKNEFSRSYPEPNYTEGLNGVSSSLKNSELPNKLNISNISDILNASNASNNSKNSLNPNKSSSGGNEEQSSSDNSDEIEIFNKKQLDHASHNRTIWSELQSTTGSCHVHTNPHQLWPLVWP